MPGRAPSLGARRRRRRCHQGVGYGGQEGTVVAVADIDRKLAQAVEDGVAPGIVALAADERGVVYQSAVGRRALGDDVAMTLDTVVWIASMTKPVTSVAAMQLVERGRISLDEALGRRVPELATVQV